MGLRFESLLRFAAGLCFTGLDLDINGIWGGMRASRLINMYGSGELTADLQDERLVGTDMQ